MRTSTRWLGLLLLAACGTAPASKHDPASEPGPTGDTVEKLPGAMPPVTDSYDDPSRYDEPSTPPVDDPAAPRDSRDAVLADPPPPPISGGTLLVTRDGRHAVAADPDRDRVSIVDLADGASLSATIALRAGDEPGRGVEDGSGLVHVALRRAGEIASIDVAAGTLVARRPVCAAPRGVAYDASGDRLLVACAGGELVALPASPDQLYQSEFARLGPGLRDVAIAGDHPIATRFKRAELVDLTWDGSSTARRVPSALTSVDKATFSPTLAYRMARASDGRTFMLHEAARQDAIDLDAKASGEFRSVSSNPYGAGAQSCQGVVQSVLTAFSADGSTVSQLLPGVLPVDFALDEDALQVAVVFAGAVDRDAPVRAAVSVPADGVNLADFDAGGPSGLNPDGLSVMVFNLQSLNAGIPSGNCLSPVDGVAIDQAFEPIAVARTNGAFVVQTREPAQLLLVRPQTAAVVIDLEGASVRDTGHTLFHHDAGGGVACASCHGEGGEDGHVWNFSTVGERRTQALNVGLAGTAPFHWSGDMKGVPELVEEVLFRRMGGVHESAERSAALQRWLFSLRPQPKLRAGDDPAAARGRALFEGEAECSKCHNGDKLTNNHNEDVGTGESLQVPSLIGVGYRGPWLHTGCANTLRDRFAPACGGGDKHGKTGQLSDAQLDDLVAYLESL